MGDGVIFLKKTFTNVVFDCQISQIWIHSQRNGNETSTLGLLYPVPANGQEQIMYNIHGVG